MLESFLVKAGLEMLAVLMDVAGAVLMTLAPALGGLLLWFLKNKMGLNLDKDTEANIASKAKNAILYASQMLQDTNLTREDRNAEALRIARDKLVEDVASMGKSVVKKYSSEKLEEFIESGINRIKRSGQSLEKKVTQ